jgi:hypothetical protein
VRARSLAIGALALAAIAQVVPTSGADPESAKTAAAPVIPLELQVEYFRTDGALAHLQAQMAEAQSEFEAAVKAVVRACGPDSAPTLTQDKKHLFCVAQPTAKKP